MWRLALGTKNLKSDVKLTAKLNHLNLNLALNKK
jgi:hypothetical protein